MAVGSDKTGDDRWDGPGPSDIVDQSSQFANEGRAAATLAALRNGNEIPQLDDNTADALGRSLSANQSTRAASMARINQMRGFGVRGFYGPGRSHNGRRDYWQTFGYPDPETVTPEDYEEWAEQGIPKIVVEAPVDECWKHAPIIRDDGRDDGDEPSQFEKDIQTLLDGSTHGSKRSERAGMNTYWRWVDEVQRPVQFGLLFSGYDDGRTMDQPVNANAIDGTSDLSYCNVFSQSDVTKWYTVSDFDIGDPILAGARRKDMPVLYEIEFERSNADGSKNYEKRTVHYTRLQHIIEGPKKSEWLGGSCLKPLLNRFIDLEKGVGSAAEAQYSNIQQKFIATGNDTGKISTDREEMVERWGRQVQEMQDDMRSGMFVENADVKEVSGDTVDPSGLLDSLWPFISGVSGQPQRIMKGSERGDLASSQDDANWASNNAQRQRQTNAPRMVRPTVDDWIRYGIVAEPDDENNSYTVHWRSLFELTDLEVSEIRYNNSRALKNTRDAIAAGAEEKSSYEAVGLPHPDNGGQTGSGSRSPDAAAGINENDPEVLDQFERMSRNSVEGPSRIEPNEDEPDEVDFTAARARIAAIKANADDYDTDDVDEVFEKYEEVTNMSASSLKRWKDTECLEDYVDAQSDEGDAKAAIDRNVHLKETNKDDWGESERSDAVDAISFIGRHGEQTDSENEVPGDNCDGLTMNAAGLRSWAMDPTETYS